MNSTSLSFNEKSYFILSAHRPVTFAGVFEAPFEDADDPIVVILNRHLPATLQFGRFQVRLFHRDQTQRYHECNRCGHFTRFLFCFDCDNLGQISKECPDSSKCCICKSLDQFAIDCEFS